MEGERMDLNVCPVCIVVLASLIFSLWSHQRVKRFAVDGYMKTVLA